MIPSGFSAARMLRKPATVEADDRTCRSKAMGNFDGGVAPAASDAQDLIAAAKRQRGKHLFAMQTEPSREDVTPRVEFRHENRIPEIDVGTSQFERLRSAYGSASCDLGKSIGCRRAVGALLPSRRLTEVQNPSGVTIGQPGRIIVLFAS